VTFELSVVDPVIVIPPSSNPFSQSGNVITMNFTIEDGDHTIDMRNKVRVRNL